MDELRKMDAAGFIGFSIKAEDTEQNQKIHDAFRELARVECRDDYTAALELLLRYYEADAKTEMLWDAIQVLEHRIIELEEADKAPRSEEDNGTF